MHKPSRTGSLSQNFPPGRRKTQSSLIDWLKLCPEFAQDFGSKLMASGKGFHDCMGLEKSEGRERWADSRQESCTPCANRVAGQ